MQINREDHMRSRGERDAHESRVPTDLAAGQRVIALYRLFLPQCLTAEQIPPDRQRFIGRPWLMTDERPSRMLQRQPIFTVRG